MSTMQKILSDQDVQEMTGSLMIDVFTLSIRILLQN
jgi:hypothetical protein